MQSISIEEKPQLTDEEVSRLIALYVTGAEKIFYEFVKQAWNLIQPFDFIDGWYIKAICDHLQAVYEGDITRLIINIPPRCGKSSIVSILFPVWVWINSPAKRFLTGSCTHLLALRDTTQSRNVINSDWYQTNWGDRFKFKDDQNQKTYYENNKNGRRVAFSIGGDVIGHGGDIILLDDPISPEHSTSKPLRQKVNDFISQSLMTRLNHPTESAFVLIMQRLHDEDPTGYLRRNSNKWEHLMLPLEFESHRRCRTSIFTDPRKNDGEILTQRYNKESVDIFKDNHSELAYSGQYQQRPEAPGGNILNINEFRRYKKDDIPKFRKIIQSWDTAYKTGESNDYSAGITIGMTDISYYILDVINKRMKFSQLKELMEEYYIKWNPHKILIEDKASGISIIQELKNTYLPVVAIKIDGNKESRAHSISPLLDCGKVYLPEEASWLKKNKEGEDFLDQLRKFPKGKHDDMVDAFTMGLMYLKRSRSKLKIVRC